MFVRLTGVSKLVLGVDVTVNGGLSQCYPCVTHM